MTAELATALRTTLTDLLHNGVLSGLIVETLRLTLAILTVAVVIKALSLTPLYEKRLVTESYLEPVRDFFQRYGKRLALLLLVFIGFYRISDIVLGVISNVFFEDIGFTKTEIAGVVKTFGLFMTIAGGFLGGAAGGPTRGHTRALPGGIPDRGHQFAVSLAGLRGPRYPHFVCGDLCR